MAPKAPRKTNPEVPPPPPASEDMEISQSLPNQVSNFTLSLARTDLEYFLK